MELLRKMLLFWFFGLCWVVSAQAQSASNLPACAVSTVHFTLVAMGTDYASKNVCSQHSAQELAVLRTRNVSAPTRYSRAMSLHVCLLAAQSLSLWVCIL